MVDQSTFEGFEELQMHLRRLYKLVEEMVPAGQPIGPETAIIMPGHLYDRLRNNLFCLQADAEDLKPKLLPPPAPPPPDGEHVIDFKAERLKRRNKPPERKKPL